MARSIRTKQPFPFLNLIYFDPDRKCYGTRPQTRGGVYPRSDAERRNRQPRVRCQQDTIRVYVYMYTLGDWWALRGSNRSGFWLPWRENNQVKKTELDNLKKIEPNHDRGGGFVALSGRMGAYS